MRLTKSHQPVKLILDWDGTLTEKDTLALVAQIGYDHQRELVNSSDPSARDEVQQTQYSIPPWSEFGRLWMQDYSAHEAQYDPRTAERTTIEQERAWLSSLDGVESSSVQRVVRSGLFQGVTEPEIAQAARHALENGDVRLRSGWARLFDHVIQSPDEPRNSVQILSVNWSGSFIRNALSMACVGDQSANADSPGRLPFYIRSTMQVHANDLLDTDRPNGSNGAMSKGTLSGIRTSADKLKRLPLRCQQKLDSRGKAKAREEADELVVYVGDSPTDLDCLLAADVGICVRDTTMGSGQRELATTLARLGVNVRKLAGNAATNAGGVYWVHDLDQIRLAWTTCETDGKEAADR